MFYILKKSTLKKSFFYIKRIKHCSELMFFQAVTSPNLKGNPSYMTQASQAKQNPILINDPQGPTTTTHEKQTHSNGLTTQSMSKQAPCQRPTRVP